MKIVILSDTHGNLNGFLNVIDSNEDADLFLHLGDGAAEYFKVKEIYKNTPIYIVKGNCDNYNLPKHKTFNFDGISLHACHGDMFNVKEGLDEYLNFARASNFNIITYGHTHKRFIQNNGNLCIINPGSLTLPRTFGPSYCVLEIEKGKINAKIVEYNQNLE